MRAEGGAYHMSDASRRFDGEPRVVARIRRILGFDEEPPRLRWLSVALIVAAAVVTVICLLVLPDSGALELRWLGVAFGAVVVAQLAAVTIRVGSGVVRAAWGEAAVIVVLYAVPSTWVAPVVTAGVLCSLALLRVFGDRKPLLYVARNAALLGLAAAAAAAVTDALEPVHGAHLDQTVALTLCAGAMAYALIGTVLVAASVAARGAAHFVPAFVSVVKSKLLMVVGNVLVGLVVVYFIDLRQPLWLLLLPPGLWLLQQTYIHRLRADDERRTWQAFANATRELNQLDEAGVVMKCLDGARALFSPDEVELVVFSPDDTRLRYVADRDGNVVREEGPSSRVDDELEARRPLVVGKVPVGELRLRFVQPVPLTVRQQAAFSAFGDALAAALHDAATHRELQDVSARSVRQAAQDALTGLPNRAAMLRLGDTELRALERNTPVALLLLDIDHFKEVNDTLGHAAGDQLLRLAAARLGALARPGELLGRLGGDEFALLITVLPEDVPGPDGVRSPPLRHALRRARALTEHLAIPEEVAGVTLSVEASVGVVVAPAGSADMTELLRRSDIAMYQAKRGGGSVAWYDSAKDAGSTDRLALLAEMREALAATDQLHLVLQPAVDLATGGPSGVEALIRWRHPRRGMLTPVHFVRAVENSELLGPFTRFVLDQALGIASRWPAPDLDVPVSVNMSPRALLDPSLPDDVADLLRRHRMPARRLVLEITETVVMSELKIIDEVLGALREQGVQLAVDDFGTGYSSLTFLTRIPVDEVKVDRTFVARMVDSPEAAAIVRTTVDLGRDLGLRVVAEGVETAAQRTALAELGCTAAQGFHFSAPVGAEKIDRVLQKLHLTAQAQVIPLRADGAL
jgi:diguanylate cyclase (GGDEF)-like protein